MTQKLTNSCRRVFVLAIRRAAFDDLESMTSVYTAAWRQGFHHMFTAGVFARFDFASDRVTECREVLTNEEELRSVGGTRLTAWVPGYSPDGRRFFEKLGWRATGTTELLGLYVEQPNRLFEYERILAAMDMTRGRPRPVASLPF
jgi:hypothetical protein